jgi:hypothetical protein
MSDRQFVLIEMGPIICMVACGEARNDFESLTEKGRRKVLDVAENTNFILTHSGKPAKRERAEVQRLNRGSGIARDTG